MTQPTPDHADDRRLAQACARGNARAQQELYQQYAARLYAVCVRYMDNESDAQDVFQEGFIHIFDKIGAYRGDGPLGGWLHRTMTRRALQALRRQKPHRRLFSATAPDELHPAHAPRDENLADRHWTQAELTAALQQLAPGYRAVFNLFAVEGYGHAEIAELLGITEGASKSQYARARLALQRILREQLEYETTDPPNGRRTA